MSAMRKKKQKPSLRRKFVLWNSMRMGRASWHISVNTTTPLYKLRALDHYVGSFRTPDEALLKALEQIEQLRQTLVDDTMYLQRVTAGLRRVHAK